MQLAAGDIVDGRFEVEGLVGEGGLAEVYRVRHRTLGRVMALKLLTWRKKSLAERLVLEGRIQAQLHHPNIVAVLDLIHHDGQVGLLMEYIDAENLHEHIDRVGATPQAEALELLAPVLSAVHAAHSVGITHRDLKPANILLARVGTGIVPKVSDFGIAKVVHEATAGGGGPTTRVGSAMGTPGYLAPEQHSDASHADARADVFALGAIAYEVLTGVPAFADDEGVVELSATAHRVPVPVQQRAEVTPCVIEAIDGALTKDPDARTPTVAALAEKLLHSRPDLLAAFHAHDVKPLDLSLPPTDEAPERSTWVARSSSGAPTLEPVGGPTTPAAATTMPPGAAAGGWVVSGVLGTLLVLLLGAGAAYLATDPDPPRRPASAPPTPALPVAAPLDPPVAAPVEPPAAAPDPAPSEAPAAPVATSVAPRPEPAPASPPPVVEAPAPEPVPPPEVVVIEVRPTPLPAPTPEPSAPPTSVPAIEGSWVVKAGALRMNLQLVRDGGRLTGTVTTHAGAQVRTESLEGTVRPDGALSFRAGDLSFSGQATDRELSGTYMREGAKKALSWTARR